MGRKIINVSNRLPVTLGDDGSVKRSSGGLVAAVEGMQGEGFNLHWIGWPGAPVDSQEQAALKHKLEQESQCSPVFLTKEEADGHYEGFSNTSLWPLLHYFPSRFRYEPSWLDSYESVNRKFTEAILQIASPDDLVWVHDYQLMLVPGMLRKAMPQLKIGFFLHTPFPSYEVYRCHPNRGQLLEGLLGADLIGFHIFGYLRHFRSAVLRILGLCSEITHIRHQGRETVLGVFPIGINSQKFESALDAPAHGEHVARFLGSFEGKRIVLSVERLDYTKGLVHRLDAIDHFLATLDEAERDRIKFIFISVPSREGIGDYRQLREEVEHSIGRLNGKHATLRNSPIHFIHGSVSFEELCGLYALADVALVTPLIDGMNLVAKEYIAAKRDRPGVLILSEFAGAAEELFNALIVNPYDPASLAHSLERALDMSTDEMRRRMEPMRQRVMKFDAQAWARSFLHDLAHAVAMAPGAAPLAQAHERIAAARSGGKRIAIMLDYDGTLREIERDPAAAVPNADLADLLESLSHRPDIDVTVISGRTARDLQTFLGKFAFGLIAEHGAEIRRPHQAQWEELDQNVSYAWKQDVLRLLNLYEESTPGSYVEQKRTSLVWHYRKADPDFGAWKAKLLAAGLSALVSNESVVVRHGKKIVEVTAAQVNKGAAVSRLIEDKAYDLVLVAGDDSTDESMFQIGSPALLSIKVGEGDTAAKFRASSPAALRKFLRESLGLPAGSAS